MNDWFNLLGPAKIVSNIIAGFREGQSFVLQLPLNTHAGLMEAVAQAARFNDLYCDFIHPEPSLEPIEFLYDRFHPDGRAITEDVMLRELYDQPDFQGKVLIIKVLHETQIPEWVSFLERFAHYSRNNVSQFLRTEFMLSVVSDRCPLVRQSDPLLVNLIVDGIVQKCDAVYYAHLQLARQGQRSPEKTQLHAEAAAALALWDFRLCEILCRASLSHLLDFCDTGYRHESIVYTTLLNYAQESGWREINENSGDEELWRAGILHGFENRLEEHSAWLAMKECTEKLCQRVWTAQVTALFPILEKYRRQYIDRYHDLLTDDQTAYNGQTFDCAIEDLEIRQIWHQLRNHQKMPEQSRKHLAVLRNVRNDLAHGKVVSSDDVNTLLWAV